MFDDDFPFYKKIYFDFMVSTAALIIFAEIILLGIAILDMQNRVEYIRQIILQGTPNLSNLPASAVLNSNEFNAILREYILSRITMNIVLISVVLTGVYFIVNHLFIAPLKVILQTNQQTLEGEDPPLIDPENIPENEIGSIMRSRNEMLTTINTLYNQKTLQTLREAVDAKDQYTVGHSRRVGQISRMLGKRMNLSEEKCEELEYSGLLHDVGKIAVNDNILTKEGKLTEAEFEEMMVHPAQGENIIMFSNFSDTVKEGIRHHHEQIDGSGYPDGLSGMDIPLFGRILAVADAIDAMLSNRHYRDALSWEETRKELETNSGTQFDPEIATVALELLQPNNRDRLPEFRTNE